MSTPAPAPQSPVVTSTIRNLTPLAVGAVTYALAKANIHLASTEVSVAVNSALSVVVGGAFTLAGRWLETHRATWWGRLFLIARAPAYSPGPAPQPAPAIVEPPAAAAPLGAQPSTDGTAPTA